MFVSSKDLPSFAGVGAWYLKHTIVVKSSEMRTYLFVSSDTRCITIRGKATNVAVRGDSSPRSRGLWLGYNNYGIPMWFLPFYGANYSRAASSAVTKTKTSKRLFCQWQWLLANWDYGRHLQAPSRKLKISGKPFLIHPRHWKTTKL